MIFQRTMNLTMQTLRVCKIRNANFSLSSMLKQTPASNQTVTKVAETTTTASTNPSLGPSAIGQATHRPDNLEKKLLVWTGKYKTVDDVPPYVNQELMERARNVIRIRVANIMMVLTAIGCLIMVYTGKKAAEGGDSVVKRNLDWHKQYNDQNNAGATAIVGDKK